MRRIPLGEQDRLFLALDSSRQPWSVLVEMGVEGRLSHATTEAAVVAAMVRHPVARARLVGAEGTAPAWEVPDEPRSAPLEVADSRASGLDVARAALVGASPVLAEGPPFRVVLARGKERDSLMLALHHAAGDGVGAMRLLTSVARAYAGADDPVPAFDSLGVRDMSALSTRASLRDRARRLRWVLDYLREIADEAVLLAASGGDPGASGCIVRALTIPPGEASGLLTGGSGHTVNDRLLGRFAVAVRRWNDGHGAEPGKVSLAVPLNMRPPEWAAENVANLAAAVPVPLPPDAQETVAAAERSVHERMLRVKGLAGVIAHGGVLPAPLKRLLARISPQPASLRQRDTAAVSNLGRFDSEMGLGSDAGSVTSLRFSPPARLPHGVSVGALSRSGTVFVTLRFGRAAFDEEGASAFADAVRSALTGSD